MNIDLVVEYRNKILVKTPEILIINELLQAAWAAALNVSESHFENWNDGWHLVYIVANIKDKIILKYNW